MLGLKGFNVRKARGSKKKPGSTQPYSFCGGRKRRETGGGGARRKGATEQTHHTIYATSIILLPLPNPKSKQNDGRKAKRKKAPGGREKRNFGRRHREREVVRMRVTRTKVAAVRESSAKTTSWRRGEKLVRNFAFSLTATSLHTISLDTFFCFLAHFCTKVLS